MKDIIITGKAVRRELLILLGCFATAFCINAGAVVFYKQPAVELVSMIGYVLFLTVILYLLLWILRLIFRAARALIRRINKAN